MTYNNLITIKGGSYVDVKKAFRQWIDLYSENFSNDFQFELYKNGRGNHIIKADDRLDNDRFFYLVNYMDYPENIEYEVGIKGYTTAKNLNKLLDNQELLVYIPKSDTEYDNVYAVTKDNKHFKIDFGGKTKEVKDDIPFSTHNIDKLEKPEILKVFANKRNNHTNECSIDNIKKRFNIILIILLVIMLLNLLVPYLTVDANVYQKTTLFTGMGVGLWFFMDYEMLRHNSFYIKSFLIALGFYYYGLVLNNHYQEYSDVALGVFLYPLTFLIVQWPTRQIYKTIFNREPKTERGGEFADLVYTIILFFALAILPFLIMDYLK